MNCFDREPDLLLYGLGQLPGWQQFHVAWHLLRCPECRTRQTQLMQASQEIARVVQPAGGTLPKPLASPLWTLKSVLLVVLTVVVIVATTICVVRSHSVASAPAPKDIGCSPGLSSDLCR